ncbi:MAG: tyrosine-type recombinase/integrase [Sulfitobacter sp.]
MKTKLSLTDKFIQGVKTDRPRVQYTDSTVTGLKLRVSRSGHKSFALMLRGPSGRYETYTIGAYPMISLKKACDIARELHVDVKLHGSPQSSPTKSSKIEGITLGELLQEVQVEFSITKKSWRPRGGPGSSAYARNAIERVFASLLDHHVEAITAEQFGRAANTYVPIRPQNGKQTANGQVSRALSYLSPALDWAANRGNKYGKIGAGRKSSLNIAELRRVHDPASTDPSIKGKRERVLSVKEIRAIYPLLRFPAPEILRRKNIPTEQDFGPIALRFMLMTAARRDEVASAKWKHIDFENGVWLKTEVKDTKGGGRDQRLPLPSDALQLLKTLPGYTMDDRNDFVFPNRDGGKLDNWSRITACIMHGTNTCGWTLHDLRRTAATLMEELEVPIQTIEAILDHTDRFAKAGGSGSAGHYLVVTRIMTNKDDPKVIALTRLSEALDGLIEPESMSAIE